MHSTEDVVVNRIEFNCKSEFGTDLYVTASSGDGKLQAWHDKKSSVFEDQKILDLKIKYLQNFANIKRREHLLSFFDTKGEKTYQFECDSEHHINKIVEALRSFKATVGYAIPKKAEKEIIKRDIRPVWMDETEKWLDADLFMLNEIWDEYIKEDDAIVYSKNCEKTSLKILRVVARIDATVQDMRSLLDIHATQRQKEWQNLLVNGGELEKLSDTTSVMYFSYRSPVPFVSNRDCCYAKVRRDIPTREGEDEGFILSYRSVEHPKCPKEEKNYRAEIRGSHHIVPNKIQGGITYTFTQYSDPGGSLPKFSVNKTRAHMLIDEVHSIKNLFKK